MHLIRASVALSMLKKSSRHGYSVTKDVGLSVLKSGNLGTKELNALAFRTLPLGCIIMLIIEKKKSQHFAEKITQYGKGIFLCRVHHGMIIENEHQ
jgi:hypothetical protein